MKSRGELAIVLHTHMPYVEGFGTWPFGEEWLWEAVATSYLPLLDVLDRAPGQVTLSLTPVLCDQLEAPGALERCVAFLREVRPESHARDIAGFKQSGTADGHLIAELERSAGEYAAAADTLARLVVGGGLLGVLAPHVAWTSSATHAVLPLVATDSGIALQLHTGIESHRRRFGEWGGGFWLPECAYAPWLNAPLHDAGARATCVELTHAFGRGDGRHLQPLRTDEGLLLWPIDREMIALVWSPGGYPSHAAYRDYHGLTFHHHRVWRNDGEPYDHDAALAQARADAADFVTRVKTRLARGGVCVCALDTELLGHWWYEGVHWLSAVLDEAEHQGVELTTLDDAGEPGQEPAPVAGELAVSSWGEGGDLRTWSGPASAALAWEARTAELEVLAGARRPSDRALRELLALQSSDWAFLETHGIAGDYPRERAAAHAAELRRAMGGVSDGGDQAVRNLAPVLAGWEG
jgi:1,4-alpha-glucan branching enzyme